MGINQLWGDIGGGAYQEALLNVARILNKELNLADVSIRGKLYVYRDYLTIHRVAEALNIQFDSEGNIIKG